MENFFEYNFNINKIVLACHVASGQGEDIHNDRQSHGLALHIANDKKYIFEGSRKLCVSKNDIIFMPEHSNYIVESEIRGGCYAINFKISEAVHFEPFVLHMKNSALEKFQSAEKAFRLKTDGYEMQCKADLYSIICSMLKEYKKEYIPKSTEKIIFPAIEYIHQNYTKENISIEYLSEICGISPAYFRRIFLKCRNTSPIKYINSLRLERAKELILSDFYSVNEISELSGFGDESYFCRFFKKATGMTPTEYKLSRRPIL